jgi:hypothetical protein
VRVGVDNTGSFGFDFGSVGGALIHAEHRYIRRRYSNR